MRILLSIAFVGLSHAQTEGLPNQVAEKTRQYVLSFNGSKPLHEEYVVAHIKSFNDNITLVCFSNGHQVPAVHWYENKIRILSSVEQSSKNTKNSILTLRNLGQEDGGRKISCQEAKKGGATKSVILKFDEKKVLARLSREEDPSEANKPALVIIAGDDLVNDGVAKIEAGTALSLSCVVAGPGSRESGWFENGKLLNSTKKLHGEATVTVLKLPRVFYEDAGRTFTCRTGQFTKSVAIMFKDKELDTGAVTTSDEILKGNYVPWSEESTLVCLKQGCDESKTAVIWYENNKPISSETFFSTHVTKSTLRLQNMSLMDLGRNFTCVITNSEGFTWRKHVVVRSLVHAPIFITVSVLLFSIFLFSLGVFVVAKVMKELGPQTPRYTAFSGEASESANKRQSRKNKTKTNTKSGHKDDKEILVHKSKKQIYDLV